MKLDAAVESYVADANRLSRTAKGTLDASSAPEKESMFVGASNRTEIAAESQERLHRAAELAFGFATGGAAVGGGEVLSALSEWNRMLRGAAVDASVPVLRSFDATSGLPYVDASHVGRRALAAAAILGRGSRSSGDVGKVAAALVWHIDYRGHIFSDGCGRTGLLAAHVAGWKCGRLLSFVEDRGSYYAAPYDPTGQMRWTTAAQYFGERLQE